MSFIMMLLFLSIVVVGRVLLQYKLTGDHGIRSMQRSSSSIEKTATLLLLIASIGFIVMSAWDYFNQLDLAVNFGIYGQISGVILCILGVAFTSYSQVSMGKHWRIGVDASEATKLVVRGIYSFIRNPIYSGVLFFCLGLLILMPHVITLLCVVITIVSIDLHVRKVEEPHLRKLHGQAFTDYEKTVGRYLPTL